MHLWGANAASKIWSLINDNDERYQGDSSPLFLRPMYRELIGKSMFAAQSKKHPNSTSGRFPGIIQISF